MKSYLLGLLMCLLSTIACFSQHKAEKAIDHLGLNAGIGLFVSGEQNATYTELMSLGAEIPLFVWPRYNINVGTAYKWSSSNTNFRLSEYEIYTGAYIISSTQMERSFMFGLECSANFTKENYAFNFGNRNIKGSFNAFGYSLRPSIRYRIKHFDLGPSVEFQPQIRTLVRLNITYKVSIKNKL